MLVQALVPQPSVEGFDVNILIRLARLDQEQPHTTAMHPRQYRPTAELLAIVGSYRLMQATLGVDKIFYVALPYIAFVPVLILNAMVLSEIFLA